MRTDLKLEQTDNSKVRRISIQFLGFLLSLCSIWNGFANCRADWPQILGENRDAQSPQLKIKAAWPGELKPVWTAKIGSGYAGPAIANKIVYTVDRLGNEERLQAIDLMNGKPKWEYRWPTAYRSSIDPDSGPRCVPTISGNNAICYGAGGDLVCVDIQTGKSKWKRPLRSELKAPDGYFGAGSSPLVFNNMVIVCPGSDEAGVVALDLETGATKWKATNTETSYSAPIAIQQPDKNRILAIMRLQAFLIDASDGKVLSQINFGSRGPTVNAATPIKVAENRFLLTASYGVGAFLVEIDNDKLKEVYRGDTILSSQYNTPVKIGDLVVGVDGREDSGSAALRCFNPITRKEAWQQPGLGTAHLIACGNQVLIVALEGQLYLIDAGAEFKMVNESNMAGGIYRALPALSNGYLVVRKTVNATSGELECYKLGEQ